MNTILVTGGAGFIGSWVVERLIEEGYKVIVIDNLVNGSLNNLEAVDGRVKIIIENIKNRETVRNIFKNNEIDVCIHLAAAINVHQSIEDPEKTFNDDVLGTFYLLEEARKSDSKFVFTSTCMVYDTGNEAISEKHPTKPASPYAGAKLAGENMVLSYFYAYGMPTTVLRPFNTYGPRQRVDEWGGAVVPRFIRLKLEGKPLTIYGSGEQTRDLLYVEDCAEFIIKAAFSDKSNGEIINGGTGQDIKIKDLALLIAGSEDRIVNVPHPHPQSEIWKLRCDPSKAKKLLGWEARTTLEEGIKRTAEWIIKTESGYA
jgi:nucleoside-diphosphate-sugar epimerase